MALLARKGVEHRAHDVLGAHLEDASASLVPRGVLPRGDVAEKVLHLPLPLEASDGATNCAHIVRSAVALDRTSHVRSCYLPQVVAPNQDIKVTLDGVVPNVTRKLLREGKEVSAV
eukprot:CAMPEP_0114143066 /NCGR_PEP_ID=MMETSP0043_2-20121206/18783_1 /TAXON_ID=464988 /ORGANISM="Hemiselmis andersenii, Strain CCMP644" /LENGTH=115 /DNA_ID=CAMNT_0001237329 /DNA_START=243 /DNA_END=589 /DNA_ORIENTATION=+